MRVLVGGVGYRFLRDQSVGIHIADRLAERVENGGQGDVEVEDLGYHPVGFAQNLDERPDYDRIVLVSAVARGRPPTTVEVYRWDGALPSREEIQNRVAEAVTGVISLDNLLIVCGAFGALPDDVRVVEIEPVDEGWGDGFTPEIEAKIPEVMETVWSLTRP